RPEAFVPFSHVVALPPDVRDRFLDTVFFVSRTSDLVGSRRRFERMVAGELPGSELVFLRPVSEVVGEATGERPMLASAAGLFSIISLAMVAFGLYAVVGRSLVKQYRELAVRFALGASAQRAAYATVRPIAFASIGGLALGAILGLAIVRMLAKVLVAPPGFDLGTAIAVAITLSVGSVTAAMLVSCAGPAIRATRRDLASDLRSN
ncbi:MAG TPA: FtsX-like permease family protein, partial [Steroidobacteraceae bacterium]|nr:FtsX-like permease family protein [Steroidobacteraceae bacterium]